MASGFTAAQTGRTHDRTRPMLQQVRKFLPRRRPHMTQSGHWPVSGKASRKATRTSSKVLVFAGFELGAGYEAAGISQCPRRRGGGVAARGAGAAAGDAGDRVPQFYIA